MKQITLQIKDVLAVVQFMENLETHDMKEMRTAQKLTHELNHSLEAFNKDRMPVQLEINEAYNAVKMQFSEPYRKALELKGEEERLAKLGELEQQYNAALQGVEKAFYDKVDVVNKKTEDETKLELSDDKFKFLVEKLESNGPRFWRDKNVLVALMEKLGVGEEEK